MEEKNFKIILANGKEISGEINGNNYITKQSVTAEDVSDINLIGATNNGSPMGLNLTCCNLWTEADGTHLVFREKSFEEIQREVINAKLEYIAMMAYIDLDD